MEQVKPINAFNDNYIWCIESAQSQYVFVVDPGDAAPVIAYLQAKQKKLAGILITHHHWDHTNGVATLAEQFPDCVIYGPHNSPFEGIKHPLKEGDTITLSPLPITLTVFETPGHTLDHISYYNHDMLFCGDTLFSAGCGRLFEGTAQQMHHSMQKLVTLPDTCKVYCTHEYTRANVDFAVSVEPQNKALVQFHQVISSTSEITLPSSIAKELAINPFLRCHEASIRETLHLVNVSDDKVFETLRTLKDSF